MIKSIGTVLLALGNRILKIYTLINICFYRRRFCRKGRLRAERMETAA